jgi:hypothetical protein
MATFDQRIGPDGKTAYRVHVRRKGRATQTAAFTKLSDAKKWAQITEQASWLALPPSPQRPLALNPPLSGSGLLTGSRNR